MKILVVHGPNTPLTGKVSVTQGTRLTLDKINKSIRQKAKKLGFEVKIFQFYDESHIVKTISRNRNEIQAVLINPGALANSCYILRELISIIGIPLVEIHMAEFPFSKESFENSILKDIADERIITAGKEAYLKGLEKICHILS